MNSKTNSQLMLWNDMEINSARICSVRKLLILEKLD